MITHTFIHTTLFRYNSLFFFFFQIFDMHSQKNDTLRVTLARTFNNTDLQDKILLLHTFGFTAET